MIEEAASVASNEAENDRISLHSQPLSPAPVAESAAPSVSVAIDEAPPVVEQPRVGRIRRRAPRTRTASAHSVQSASNTDARLALLEEAIFNIQRHLIPNPTASVAGIATIVDRNLPTVLPSIERPSAAPIALIRRGQTREVELPPIRYRENTGFSDSGARPKAPRVEQLDNGIDPV